MPKGTPVLGDCKSSSLPVEMGRPPIQHNAGAGISPDSWGWAPVHLGHKMKELASFLPWEWMGQASHAKPRPGPHSCACLPRRRGRFRLPPPNRPAWGTTLGCGFGIR